MTSPFRGSTSGLTRQQLRGRRYERVSKDVYVLRDQQLDLRVRTAAALLAAPGAIASGPTAALLQRLPVDDDGAVHLSRSPSLAQVRRSGLVLRRTDIPPDERLDVDGLACTNGPRTWTDLASQLDLEGLVAVGDVVLRRYQPADLERAVQRLTGRRGVSVLRQALPLLDAGSDSPAETRARLRLHAAGFVRMRHGVIVRDAGGGWLAVPDLADEVAMVALQHEGAVHFAKGERQRRMDVARDELCREQGWEVVVSTALDDASPDRLVRRTTAAYLRAAQLRGAGVLPPHLL